MFCVQYHCLINICLQKGCDMSSLLFVCVCVHIYGYIYIQDFLSVSVTLVQFHLILFAWCRQFYILSYLLLSICLCDLVNLIINVYPQQVFSVSSFLFILCLLLHMLSLFSGSETPYFIGPFSISTQLLVLTPAVRPPRMFLLLQHICT